MTILVPILIYYGVFSIILNNENVFWRKRKADDNGEAQGPAKKAKPDPNEAVIRRQNKLLFDNRDELDNELKKPALLSILSTNFQTIPEKESNPKAVQIYFNLINRHPIITFILIFNSYFWFKDFGPGCWHYDIRQHEKMYGLQWWTVLVQVSCLQIRDEKSHFVKADSKWKVKFKADSLLMSCYAEHFSGVELGINAPVIFRNSPSAPLSRMEM